MTGHVSYLTTASETLMHLPVLGFLGVALGMVVGRIDVRYALPVLGGVYLPTSIRPRLEAVGWPEICSVLGRAQVVVS